MISMVKPLLSMKEAISISMLLMWSSVGFQTARRPPSILRSFLMEVLNGFFLGEREESLIQQSGVNREKEAMVAGKLLSDIHYSCC